MKTRLAATAGFETAAAIYRQLTAAVCARLPHDATVLAFFDPPEARERMANWLRGLCAERPLELIAQSSGDLGARLTAAFDAAFSRGFARAMALGTDCVEISAATFAECWRGLETADCVLGPSEDGGYYTIALKQPQPALFHDIAWSTAAVRGRTLVAAAELGLRVVELPRLHDVDTEEDWRRARLHLEASAPAPALPSSMGINEPIVFEPLFKERVWGGRRLESLFGKKLPPTTRIGESWEIVDREEAQSVVHSGPLRGLTLHELWTQHREQLFGPGLPDAPRFPLLFKLLDAQERLSLQVHPPARVAASLGGESKTEMWYILDALLDSDLYAGLKAGVTRELFEEGLSKGNIADLVHHLPIASGDSIFIPSGRIHAIGAGNVIFEVQQNSDTTYRVFDWNRIGLDGRARDLHVPESMESIDFNDIEPKATAPGVERLANCEYFVVEKWELDRPRSSGNGRFAIFCVTSGSVECLGSKFQRGELFLVPASLSGAEILAAEPGASVLRTTIP